MTTQTTTTFQAIVTMSDSNWNDLTIEISTDPEQPDTIWLTTTAHDFEGAQFDGVDFDGDQYAADIDVALAPEWKRTSDFTNNGGYTDAFTVERVAA